VALKYACQDMIHQPVRGAAFPMKELIAAALATGAHGAFLSGAGQELTLAHFRAQLEDLQEHIAHVIAQLEHLRDTSTGNLGYTGDKVSLS